MWHTEMAAAVEQRERSEVRARRKPRDRPRDRSFDVRPRRVDSRAMQAWHVTWRRNVGAIRRWGLIPRDTLQYNFPTLVGTARKDNGGVRAVYVFLRREDADEWLCPLHVLQSWPRCRGTLEFMSPVRTEGTVTACNTAARQMHVAIRELTVALQFCLSQSDQACESAHAQVVLAESALKMARRALEVVAR